MNIRNILTGKKPGSQTPSVRTPQEVFHSTHYLRHNARRQEHLASLEIDVSNKRILELGAGIGDHSHYFIDRKCQVTITEARQENLDLLKARYPDQEVRFLDMENPAELPGSPFDITYCYGLLYHLSKPDVALAYIGQHTSAMLLLETCVSFGEEEQMNPTAEVQLHASQAVSGTGCRPTRPWLFKELQKYFEFVYIPKTQPNHEEFPIDWSNPGKHNGNLQRAIFIASRNPLDNPKLSSELISIQKRHP